VLFSTVIARRVNIMIHIFHWCSLDDVDTAYGTAAKLVLNADGVTVHTNTNNTATPPQPMWAVAAAS
jgi:hypothetical protein